MPKNNLDLSICVLAHPSREEWFPYLKSKLGKNIQFQIDWESEGNWPNARKAWARYDPAKKFHLVIQDDAIICNNFYQRLAPHLEHDYKAMSLYWGNDKTMNRPSRCIERGFYVYKVVWGVAIMLRTDIIDSMLEWTGNREWPERYGNKCDDTRISTYIYKSRYKCYYPFPSLVDHRVEENTSLTDEIKSPKRHALKFIDNIK